jgi:hypothetical protein
MATSVACNAREVTDMKRMFLAVLLLAVPFAPSSAQDVPPAGFVSLFNGKDLSGWRIPQGDNGHWRVVDGMIDYDAESEAAGDKSLWSEKEYGDFTLRVDWRIKDTPYTNPNVHIVLPDGTSKRDATGKPILMAVPDSDSASTCAVSPRRRSTSGAGRSAPARSTAIARTRRCRRRCAPA